MKQQSLMRSKVWRSRYYIYGVWGGRLDPYLCARILLASKTTNLRSRTPLGPSSLHWSMIVLMDLRARRNCSIIARCRDGRKGTSRSRTKGIDTRALIQLVQQPERVATRSIPCNGEKLPCNKRLVMATLVNIIASTKNRGNPNMLLHPVPSVDATSKSLLQPHPRVMQRKKIVATVPN